MLLDIDDNNFLDPEIEDYIKFLQEDEQQSTGFLTHRKVRRNLPQVGELLNLFVAYPDMFVDLLVPKKSNFKLHFFQRILLRCFARGEQTFATFSRGTSKSFLADLDRYLKCMFLPNHNVSIVAGTKTQAAQIAKQKIIDDLWVKFPLLANEMQKRRIAGKLQEAFNNRSDHVEFRFKNGSSFGLGNVRGLRRESLVLEEVIEQDEVKVNEVYLPLLNKPRVTSFGEINPYEPQSQELYVTTAGYQNTFSYDKMIEIMCRSMLEPTKYFVLTGTYRLSLMTGLITPAQIQKIISSPTFSKESWEREYCSTWSDSPVGAAFSSNLVGALRQVKRVELKYNLTEKMEQDGAFYAIAADMAKDGSARTVVLVAKVSPKEYFFHYKIVNLFTVDSSDYMVIANKFKETVLDYKAKVLVYDANGIGAAIRDWLNKPTETEQGLKLDGLGIINPPTTSEKDVIRYPKDRTICYEIKSAGDKGEQIHHLFFARMSNGSVTFPLKMAEAVNLYSKNKSFGQLSQRRQKEVLLPYKTMDIMEEELKNLDVVRDTADKLTNRLKIVRRNTKLQKDFFSAGEYLVYGVNQYIEMDYYKHKKKTTTNRLRRFIFE